jgi:hypothetical protein
VPTAVVSPPSWGTTLLQWCRQHIAGLVLGGLLLLSLLLSVF